MKGYDFSKYTRRKNKGLIKIERNTDSDINATHILTIKKFDPETGDKVDDEVNYLSLPLLASLKVEILDQIAELKKEIREIEVVELDIETTP